MIRNRSLARLSRELFLVSNMVLLSGCPLVYSANIRNGTDDPIEIVRASPNASPESIGANATVTVPWFNCISVGSRSFEMPDSFPKGIETSGRFSSIVTFDIVINGGGLFFVGKKNNLIPIQQVESCDEL